MSSNIRRLLEIQARRRQTPARRLVTAWLVASLACAAQARDEERATAVAIADAIESCVDESAIRFGQDDRRTILNPPDAEAVSAALVRRYPMLSQDGFEPQSIVLWRKPEAGWLYITLLVNPAKPGEVCFTATFVADRFELTAPLLEKYFETGTPNK